MNNLFRLIPLLVLTVLTLACFASGPESTVKKFYGAIEEGEIDKASEMLSSRILGLLGPDKLRQALSKQALEIKKKGGIKSIDVLEMNEVGEIAEGKVKITYDDGSEETEGVKLVKEEGKWKLDADK
jgi:hypothetical protein